MTRPGPTLLSRGARALLTATCVAALAAGAAAWRFGGAPHGWSTWTTFAVLAVLTATAQLLVVPAGRNHGFHTSFVFVSAAALLLPPGLAALMGLAQHGVEGVVKRRPWYIQAFNVANTTLNVLAASTAARLVGFGHGNGVHWALSAWTAAAVLVLANLALLAAMLRLARGRAVRETGLFSLESLTADFVPAVLGVVVAHLWHGDLWLVPAAVVPIVLAHRTFGMIARLRQSEERSRTIVESSPTGISLTNLDGTIASVNPALEEMLGYAADELVGRRWADVIDPEDVEAAVEAARAVARGAAEGRRLELGYLARNGETVFGYASLALVRDSHNQPQYILATIENVTERKELAQRLAQSQKLEAIGRLAGGVAHDFNNMLTAITAYSELGLARLDAGQPVTRRPLEEIKKAAERSATLTARLLAFSRKQTLKPQLLDPNAIVEDLDGMLERLIGRDVRIVTRLDGAAGRITADPGQLEQVILNLVVNARDAMPDGGTIRIETASAELGEEAARRADTTAGRHVVIVVADDGCGMTPETRARIFEPFFTTKDEGTGLGLSTVYGIVAQSGGFIELDSEPGRGTTFRLHFPQAAGPVAPVQAVPPARAGAGRTVLLVDDQDAVRETVAELLEEAGWRVLAAASGDEALALAEELDEIDLLLSDVAMPGIGGVELARRLLARGLEPRIVFMSGYAGEAFEQRASLGVPVGFLQKPFSAAELHAELAPQLARVA